jgi:hypothetical protein
VCCADAVRFPGSHASYRHSIPVRQAYPRPWKELDICHATCISTPHSHIQWIHIFIYHYSWVYIVYASGLRSYLTKSTQPSICLVVPAKIERSRLSACVVPGTTNAEPQPALRPNGVGNRETPSLRRIMSLEPLKILPEYPNIYSNGASCDALG